MNSGLRSEAMRDKMRFRMSESPDSIALENEQRLRALEALRGQMMGVNPEDTNPSIEQDVAKRAESMPDEEAIKMLVQRMRGVTNG